jgi:hypothetical protein
VKVIQTGRLLFAICETWRLLNALCIIRAKVSGQVAFQFSENVELDFKIPPRSMITGE